MGDLCSSEVWGISSIFEEQKVSSLQNPKDLSLSKGDYMKNRLWFVTDGIKVLSVFDDRKSAQIDKERYQDDPDYIYFDHYSIDLSELNDYPDEFDLAIQKGFVE